MGRAPGLVDEVLPVELANVDRARLTVLERQTLSARDALHLAVMACHNVREILSFDAGFDGRSGIRRVR